MTNNNLDNNDKALMKVIVEEMKSNEREMITFRRYMELCLYHPEYGYYMKSNPKVGLNGDFYTSSHVGTLMGEILAHYIAGYWQDHPEESNYCIAEWGGGSGRLAGQILDELQAAFPILYKKVKYIIIDTSPYHRDVQEKTVAAHRDSLHIHTPESWGTLELPNRTVVVSNELLDAFSVHRMIYSKGKFHEIYVSWDEATKQFCEQYRQLEEEHPLCVMLAEHEVPLQLEEEQMLEVNPSILPWVTAIGDKLTKGMLILVDYGDLAEHLYTSNRMKGTYMCYYRHQGHDNPYVNVGNQDITAHVNFSACIRAGIKSGLIDWSFATQRSFLMNHGLLERLQNHNETDPFHPVVKRNRAIRTLLLGDGLGETFKVLVQKKGEPV
jgi:SAM-dependent MidA family methyltransferase